MGTALAAVMFISTVVLSSSWELHFILSNLRSFNPINKDVGHLVCDKYNETNC